MNELMMVFAAPAAVALVLATWSARGWYDSRGTKAQLLKKAEEVIGQLEDLAKKNSNAQAAADDATLKDLQGRFKAL